jgi:hypothetical protein
MTINYVLLFQIKLPYLSQNVGILCFGELQLLNNVLLLLRKRGALGVEDSQDSCQIELIWLVALVLHDQSFFQEK